MFRSHRFATPAVLLTLGAVLAGSGCGSVDPALIDATQLPDQVKVLRLRLPSFAEDEVQGVWMWRRSEATGEFEPVSEIRFLGIAQESEREFLDYRLIDPSGEPIDLSLSAEILRNGDSAELVLWFVRFSASGEFKASVYNAAGASPLSQESIVL